VRRGPSDYNILIECENTREDGSKFNISDRLRDSLGPDSQNGIRRSMSNRVKPTDLRRFVIIQCKWRRKTITIRNSVQLKHEKNR